MNVCFQRLNAKSMLNEKDEIVVKFIPDPSINKIKEARNAGLVKIKFNLTMTPTVIKYNPDDDDDRKMSKKQSKSTISLTNYWVIANIFQVL